MRLLPSNKPLRGRGLKTVDEDSGNHGIRLLQQAKEHLYGEGL
jgi:hypothetical protein